MRLTDASVRFERNLAPSNGAGCRIWTGRVNAWGYGCFSVKSAEHGRFRPVLAHRFAYERVHGPIPKGMILLHSCDTPACCAVEHLALGTHADNMADMKRKGRHRAGRVVAGLKRRGEAHPLAKLTVRDVATIRQLAAEGVFQKVIAQRFGITQTGVSRIVRRVVWKDVPREVMV
jgi:hypothetical protein